MSSFAGQRAGPIERCEITSISAVERRVRFDAVVGEEPLEIRVGGPGQPPEAVAVIMRTPGNDFELAVGFLLSEGIIGQGEIDSVRYCDVRRAEQQRYNVVSVQCRRPTSLGERRRAVAVSASCGICGTATLDQLADRCPPVTPGPVIDAAILTDLPDRLRRHQRLFDSTGGIHGAGLFGHDGRMLAVREDVGRHNAVDKLVGWAALASLLPLTSAVLVVSGRVSYEIVQKAAVAGVPAVVAVSAPSSLAVATARRLGMTLAAFVRDGSANVYAGPAVDR